MLILDDFRVKGRDIDTARREREKRQDEIERAYAPKVRTKARPCTSKRRFRDLKEVRTVLHILPQLRAYECRFCGGFHLTKNIDVLERWAAQAVERSCQSS